MQYTTCAPFYLAQPPVEAIEKLFDQKGDAGLTPTERAPRSRRLHWANQRARLHDRRTHRGCDRHIDTLDLGDGRLPQSRE